MAKEKNQPDRASDPNPDSVEKDTGPLVTNVWTRSSGRQLFLSLLQNSIVQGAKKPDYLFAILYVDLDRLTLVNDSLGRTIGDRLLIEVLERLQGCLRAGDTVIRLREDEYLIFLDNIVQISNAQKFAERVINDVLRPAFRLGGQEVFVSASIGIARGPAGYTDAEAIVLNAEAAMHRAKVNGRGSCELFRPELHDQAKTLFTLESQLRTAIDQNQLRLEYEPIIALDTRRVAGFETLVRWMHPERGLVYPGEFLPTAEETGLIIPITRWVIQEACRQLRQWQNRLPGFSSLWLSVNLSPQYIEKSDFAQDLATHIAESGVDASNLVVEITEHELLEKADHILKGFRRLNETGIKLWIDDFGSGYSSFAYLAAFPIQALKMDRSFISKLTQDNNSNIITKAIVSLGKNLGFNVIAEGVETQEQFDYLRSLECPYGQGHFFGKSMDGGTVEASFRSYTA